MTQVNPLDDYFGQHGMDDKGLPLVSDRNDPRYHLAVMLGMLHGDTYRQPTPTDPQADPNNLLTSDDMIQRSQFHAPAIKQAQDPTQSKNVLGAASKYLGVKYVYGANDPTRGLDCSSFVQRAFADVGVNLPRVTYDQVKMGVGVADKNQLQPGDLIFMWGDGNRRNGHVGIYMGNGVMINAPHTGAVVRYDSVPWNRVTAMRRVG